MSVIATVGIGGTKTAAALVREDGNVYGHRRATTPAPADPAALLDTGAPVTAAFDVGASERAR